MKRPQKLAVMLVPTPPYEICGIGVRLSTMKIGSVKHTFSVRTILNVYLGQAKRRPRLR